MILPDWGFLHRRTDRLAAVDGGGEVDVHYVAVVVFRSQGGGLFLVRAQIAAGVVDEYVDAAKVIKGLGDQGIYGWAVGNIHGNAHGAATELDDFGFHGLGREFFAVFARGLQVYVGDDNVRAQAGQMEDVSAAQAARATGDESYFTFERHRKSPFRSLIRTWRQSSATNAERR